MPSLTEIQRIVEEIVRAYPEKAEKAREGVLSAEGYLVARASHQAEEEPGEVRPVVRRVVQEGGEQ